MFQRELLKFPEQLGGSHDGLGRKKKSSERS